MRMRVCPHCQRESTGDGMVCPSCGKARPSVAAAAPAPLGGTFLFPPGVPAGRASAAKIAPSEAPRADSMRITMSGTGMPSARQKAPSSPPPNPPPEGEPSSGAPLRALTTQDSLPIPDPRTSVLGAVVDGFAIDSILGSGGCGTVYRGRQLGLDRPVAIKVPSFEVVDDPVLKKRFLREARAAARVRHPSVVTIYGVGELPDGRPYLAMELLDGASLARLIDDGPLETARALALARKIALALAETHAAGVVHRDLKPSNIIWRTERGGGDHVTLVDFGIAAGQQGSADATRLTAGGKVIGTPHYMAPEQVQGEHREVDHRSDLYALGCVLFELLTAEVPFDGTGFEVVLAHMTKAPPAPSSVVPQIPPEVDALVAGLLRKRPEERIASADEVVAQIDEVLEKLAAGPDRTDPALPSAASTAPAMVVPPPARSQPSSLSLRTHGAGSVAALAATAAALPAPAGPTSWPSPAPTRPAAGTLPPGSSPPQVVGPAAPSLLLVAPGPLPREEPVPTTVTRRPRRWLAVAALALTSLGGVGVWALAARSGASAPPPVEMNDVMTGSDSISMRLRHPRELHAGEQAEIQLELWKDDDLLVEQGIVVTVQDPAGKFTGFDAEAAQHSGAYSFRHGFHSAGRYLVQIHVPVDDATLEVPLEVGPAR